MAFSWIAVLVVVFALLTTIAARRRNRAPIRVVPTLTGAVVLPERLTPITDRARHRYSREIASLSEQFPAAPVETLREAERLVGRILRDRGFPYLDPAVRPQAVAELFPTIADEYRAARSVMQRFDSGGSVAVDEMRDALGSYRAIASGLLDSA
jgi:hypothetical protein